MGSRLDANSTAVRKRIEKHTFADEEGEEYEPSRFGGFTDYFRRKKIKLQNLDAERRSSSTANPPIFRGIVAQVNGYTQPSLNDLHALIVSYGGGFMQYLDGKTTVTHIIASNLTPKKKIEFRRYRIVKPAWVVDSVKAGKLLPWDAYRVLDEGAGQQVLGFDSGKVISQVNSQQRGYRDQTDNSWYTSQVKG
jgi:DNA repair protein REV1